MKCILMGLAVLFSAHAYAINWQDSDELTKLFEQAGATGTFVLYEVSSNTYRGHNRDRAETRFTPASTFKIPNSLIGLAVGAVKSVDETFPYDGSPRFLPAWEKDMGLREAIAVSNVPVYQELARRIGLQRMQQNLARIGYGNQQIGNTVDTFWLTGPLKISAVEQTQFLAKLARDELPFPANIQHSVQEITVIDQGKDWQLHAKTGWQNAPGEGVGWWVGWIEKDRHIFVFALNLDIHKTADADLRISLGKSCLKALGLL